MEYKPTALLSVSHLLPFSWRKRKLTNENSQNTIKNGIWCIFVFFGEFTEYKTQLISNLNGIPSLSLSTLFSYNIYLISPIWLHFVCKLATTDRATRTQNPFFRRRYGYTSTTKSPRIPSTVDPETVSISSLSGLVSARYNTDQEHEPSIIDRKFSHSNQIDLGTEIISQGLGEAITSISRAPLPFVASTTVRNVKITTPGAVKYDDDSEYQISKRADSLSSGCKYYEIKWLNEQIAQINAILR